MTSERMIGMQLLEQLDPLWSVAIVLHYAVLLTASIYGICRFFVHKSPLYFRLLTLATVCYTMVEYFRLFYYMCYGSDFEGLGITFFGYFGCFLFFLTANYGQYDSLIDDGTVKFRKYRLLALAAPVVLTVSAFCYTAGNVEQVGTVSNIITFVGFVLVIFASYFNLKHLIIPDQGFGFIRWVRLINLCVLVIEVLDAVRLYLFAGGGDEAGFLAQLLISFAFMLMLIFARKGQKSWLV